jgi:hypothetical protein
VDWFCQARQDRFSIAPKYKVVEVPEVSLTQCELAAALGITLRAVQKRIARGMPGDSIEAARAWSRMDLRAPRGSGISAEAQAVTAHHPQAAQLLAQLRAALNDCMATLGLVPATGRISRLADTSLPQMAAEQLRMDVLLTLV